jgi:hypothetical protein
VLPGLGHAALGRTARGAAYFGLVATAFVTGLALDGRLFTPDPQHPLTILASLASYASGALAFAARPLGLGAGNLASRTYEYGTTFLATAGLMNVLLMFDVYDIGAGRKR